MTANSFMRFLVGQQRGIEDSVALHRQFPKSGKKGPLFRAFCKAKEITADGCVKSSVLICWPLVMKTARAKTIYNQLIRNLIAFSSGFPNLKFHIFVITENLSIGGIPINNDYRNKASILVELREDASSPSKKTDLTKQPLSVER